MSNARSVVAGDHGAAPPTAPKAPSPETVRLTAADAPSARGRTPGAGEPYTMLTLMLDDGRRLIVECGRETAAHLRTACLAAPKSAEFAAGEGPAA